jgi:hypothetical protein
MDFLLGDELTHQVLIARVTDNERHVLATARSKPVDRLSSSSTRSPASASSDQVAADTASVTCYKD